MKTTLLLLFIVICSGAFAQDISATALTWTVDHLTDLKTSEDFDYSCSFKTNGNQDVTWLQRAGAVTSTLSTQSVSGTWTDVSATGVATYSITANGKSGTLKFERNNSGIFITLDLTPSDSTGLKHQYRVTNIQTN